MNKINRIICLTVVLLNTIVFNAEAICSNCATPTNLNVSSITNTGAYISWTPGSGCSDFRIDVQNNYNYSITTFYTTNAYYNLSGLDPATPYTIYVSMVSTALPPVSCLPETANFMTTQEGIGCDCAEPIGLNVTNITNNSADVNWISPNGCSDFYVTVTHCTGAMYTYVVTGATSFTITGLSPNSFTNVSVRNIANVVPPVDCIPAFIDFNTTYIGEDCYGCASPSHLSITPITSTTAYLSWTAGSSCHNFEIRVNEQLTGNQVFYGTTTNTYYNLTGLAPSTNYDVFVAQVSNECPGICCLGIDGNFRTDDCVEFTNNSDVFTTFVGLWDGSSSSASLSFYSPWDNSTSYVQMSPTYSTSGWAQTGGPLQINTSTTYGIFFDVYTKPFVSNSGSVYFKLWIDWNNDGSFGSGELVINHTCTNCASSLASNPTSTINGISCTPNGGGSGWNTSSFTTPGSPTGPHRARFICSVGETPGPCDDFATGSVQDFLIEVQ